MALFKRIIQSSGNLFLLNKNNHVYRNNGNVNFASLVKKSDLPSPPKKPLTAYMLFCKEQRRDLKEENPGLTSPQQIKLLAEKWSNLSNDSKKPYEDVARRNTLDYGEAHKKFYESLTTEQKEEMTRLKYEKRESRRLLKLKKALKESGLPKYVVSSYALFIQSQAANKGDVKSATEFIKQCAEKWKSVTDDEKRELESKTAAAKKQHAIEMEKWRKRMIAEGKTNLLKEFDALKGKGKLEANMVVSQKRVQARKEESARRGSKNSKDAKN